jgi:hypothetical protein
VHVALGQALIIYIYAHPYRANKSAVVTVGKPIGGGPSARVGDMDIEVLLRLLPLLILSVFIDPDSEACELIGDLEASMISIRHNRSFNDAAKVANFSSNEGSDWVCARVC